MTPLFISDYSETDHSEEKEGEKSCAIKNWNLGAETLLCVPPITRGRINLTWFCKVILNHKFYMEIKHLACKTTPREAELSEYKGNLSWFAQGMNIIDTYTEMHFIMLTIIFLNTHAGLTLASYQLPTQLLSHCPSSTRQRGENKMTKTF